ncbi:MAG TPA: fumarylacetoacetate hydrolase family protein [Pseudonocardia sp.]
MVEDDRVLDLQTAGETATGSGDPAFASMLDLIAAGQDGLQRARSVVTDSTGRVETTPLADVTLMAPVPEPAQMRDALCFELHCLFGVFIGRSGLDIPRDSALEHVFGYTIFNDFSARDAQFAEVGGGLGPAKGKDFKGGNALGPWIVTADEIPNPYELEMVVRVNGEERGRGNSASMHWRFEDLIARVSDCEELRAGEFLASGTVGNGSGLEIGRFLEHEDVVELEIERIGTLRNRVLDPARLA